MPVDGHTPPLQLHLTAMKHLKMALAGFLLLSSGATRSSNTRLDPLNLSFEENHGQAPDDVRFLARGHGYNLLLTPEGNRLLLRRGRQAPRVSGDRRFSARH